MARNEARVHVYCQPGYVVLGFLTVLFSYDVGIPFLTDISGSTPRAIVSNPISGMHHNCCCMEVNFTCTPHNPDQIPSYF